MDPKAALENARSAIAAGDKPEAREFLSAYAGWRSAGGFMPEIYGRAGDEEYRALRLMARQSYKEC